MNPRAIYVGIAPGGRVVASGDSAQGVAHDLKKAGVDKFWLEDDGPLKDLQVKSNPPVTVETAVRIAGLRPVSAREVEGMSLKEAWDRLYPTYFAPLRKKGEAIKAFQTPTGLARSIMSRNSKLGKGAANPASDVSFTMQADLIGLNLVPNNKLVNTLSGVQAGYRKWFPDGPAIPLIETVAKRSGMTTFCAGASNFCSAACLIFTGSNESDPYNDHVKAMRSLALLGDPAAFLRMVDHAIEQAKINAAQNGERLLVRMNLLSDIPWEVVCPWLFARHPDVQFYDYTKIMGRKSLPNYDLTYSFSGTNKAATVDALYEKNRRIAMVFLAKQLRDGTWESIGESTRRKMGERSLPSRFDLWGPPRLVVNADINDARFLDPPNELDGTACVAGLIWKSPKGQAIDADDRFGFVTPAYLAEGEGRPILISPVTPRSQGDEVGAA